jgi:hypothetical protein
MTVYNLKDSQALIYIQSNGAPWPEEEEPSVMVAVRAASGSPCPAR